MWWFVASLMIFSPLCGKIECKKECKASLNKTSTVSKDTKYEYVLINSGYESVRDVKLPKEMCEKYKERLGGKCQQIK